jgi:16S rRNA (cytosine967-C5)-methyltransferase
LVYATCSLLSEENEDQVTAFLARHPGFALVPLVRAWPGAPPGIAPVTPGHDAGEYLSLTPARHGTDGFFAAVLERRA